MQQRRILSIFLAIIMVISLFAVPNIARAVEDSQDQSKWILKYDKPANISKLDQNGWEKYSLPIGNGYMGAGIFGGIKRERIQLNEKTLWTGGPSPSRPNYIGGNKLVANNGMNMKDVFKEIQRNFLQGNNRKASDLSSYLIGEQEGYGGYQSFGNIYIDFENHNNPINYERNLDLEKSLSTVEYEIDGTKYKREYFANYPQNVIAAKISASEKNKLNFTISLESDQGAVARLEDGKIVLAGKVSDNGLKFESQLALEIKGGEKEELYGKKLKVSNASEAYIYFTAATNYENKYPKYRKKDAGEPHTTVLKNIENALNLGYEKLYESHEQDYKNIFDRVNLELGLSRSEKFTDELVEGYMRNNSEEENRFLEILLFHYGRYLLISSSRVGSLPANLQGVWNNKNNAPWSSDYHMNVNLQMNYWPSYVTNMSETAIPLLEYVESLREPGRVTADIYMGVRSTPNKPKNGFTAHTQNTPFGWTTPGWSFDWGWSPAAVPWILQNVYEYYEFTRDKAKLVEIYDILKEEVTLYEQILVYDPKTDRMVSAPSYSPEHGPRTMGNTYEQSLIWQLYHDAIEAAKILNVDGDKVKKWTSTFEKLKPISIGDSGQIKEWTEETTLGSIGQVGHRHISHLLGLFPGDLITLENEKLIEAAKVSMNHRGDAGTGWAIAQKINAWARTGDGNRAHKLIVSQLQNCILPNLWDSHPPFQIDGNFGYTSGVAEMLLQSNAGYINLLPALPDAWSTGSYEGLVARGNFELSLKWKDKNIEEAKVLSKSGGKAIVQARGISSAKVLDENGREVEKRILSDSRIEFITEKGKEYKIIGFEELNLKSNSGSLTIGRKDGSLRLLALDKDKNDVSDKAVWKLDKENLAKVDKGVVTAGQKAGRVLVTASYKGIEKSIYVDISFSHSEIAEEWVDNRDSRIKFSNNWAEWTESVHHDGSIHFVQDAGAVGSTIELKFNGVGIDVITPTNSTFAAYEVYIDGSLVKTINLFENGNHYQVNIFSDRKLSEENEDHTITLKVVGVEGQRAKAEFDSFVVFAKKDIEVTNHEVLQKELERYDSLIQNLPMKEDQALDRENLRVQLKAVLDKAGKLMNDDKASEADIERVSLELKSILDKYEKLKKDAKPRWSKEGENWRYYDADGKMVKSGWRFAQVRLPNGKVTRNWKYFNKYGNNIEKFYNEKGNTHLSLIGPNREYAKGWYKLGRVWTYYEGSWGKMVKSSWRFLDVNLANGKKVKNWKYFDRHGYNIERFYNEKGNTHLSLIGPNKEYAKGWYKLGRVWTYYEGSWGKMVKSSWRFLNLKQRDGVYTRSWKFFNQKGYSVNSIYRENNNTYYSLSGPYKAYKLGEMTLGNYEYYFSSPYGKMTSRIRIK